MDSSRLNSFSSKDLALVKTIANQIALAFENRALVAESEKQARMTENLSRFMPPHVVCRALADG